MAVVSFWSIYQKWRMVDPGFSLFGAIIAAGAFITLYLAFILPLLPPIHWTSFWKPPSELLTASPWYFLPKSIEIILQQLLVLATVLAFNARKYTLREISNWSARLFGGIYLLLVFGQSFSYVVVFTLAATAAGFVFPYLLLRVRNGFISSFSLHWTFCAVIIVLIRILYVH